MSTKMDASMDNTTKEKEHGVSRSRAVRKEKIVQLHTEEEKRKFLKECEILLKLSLPMQMPFFTRAKEIIYLAAEELGISIIEINTKEVHDTSSLMEQVSIEERQVVTREGILASAMREGCWVILNCQEIEDPVAQYIIEKHKSSSLLTQPRIASAKSNVFVKSSTFQVFLFSKDYVGQSNYLRGQTYPFILPPEEAEDTFLKRAAASLSGHLGTSASAESLVNIAVSLLERYGKKRTEDIRKEEEAGNAFEMILSAMARALSRSGSGEEERVRLVIVAQDILLAQKAPEEREKAKQDLLQFLCIPESAAEEHEASHRKETLRLLENSTNYIVTNAAARVISFVARNLHVCSSFLLVGETGTGKTTAVQKIFEKRKDLLTTAHKNACGIICVNLSKDTDLSDLLGAYHFATLNSCCTVLNDAVHGFFGDFFAPEKNRAFLQALRNATEAKEVGVVQEAVGELLVRFKAQTKEKKTARQEEAIKKIEQALCVMQKLQAGARDICLFIEGPLTRAFLYGYWILLDESNLASTSVLEYLSNALQKESLVLLENSGMVVQRDPRTAIFQCMNPGDDHGKKEVYMSITMRLWMDEVDAWPEDVQRVAQSYRTENMSEEAVEKMTQFYMKIRQVSKEHSLRVGSGRAALFGIRNLIRAVQMASTGFIVRALETSFLTQLCLSHKNIGRRLIAELFPEEPSSPHSFAESSTSAYTVTPQTETYLNEISMAVSVGTAVLLEGGTSVGKTSMVKHLARTKGKKIVRINNHEHTEASEYLGSYTIADSTVDGSPNEEKSSSKSTSGSESGMVGTDESNSVVLHRAKRPKKGSHASFTYKEGTLVSAVRDGDWVLLDELNLAPTEVLESLNRLLDSNREIFIPATQEYVKAHPEFALFATQNPAESLDYKNRKHLSKAFRNRFVEIFVEERSREEVEAILCGARIGRVSVRALLEVYESLRTLTGNRAQEYATLREIMRIVKRMHGCRPSFIDPEAPEAEVLFIHTMMVLTEKISEKPEKHRVSQIIASAFEKTFRGSFSTERYKEAIGVQLVAAEGGPLITPSVIRLLRKIEACWCAEENVLLIGPPGTGKTYLSEYVAQIMGEECTIMSMHAGMELSDFVGGYVEDIEHSQRVFRWKDGPLVQRMKKGGLLVIDEINLVPDSVLESLNELFDDRKLRVHETGMEHEAAESFRLVGTMNPGDDYGKREIGRSVANRFTVVHVDSAESREEALKYFMHYAEKYGVSKICREAAQVYREMHRAVAAAEVAMKSAREAEILARYTAQHPELGRKSLHEIIVEGLEILSGKTPKEDLVLVDTEAVFGIAPFILQKSRSSLEPDPNNGLALSNTPRYSQLVSAEPYVFEAPSIKKTLYRVMQGLFSRFNILLEGPPGTGKTKMIMELGKKLGKRVSRINLSKETEMADLVGRNTPTENGIAFLEGELCRAVQRGDWVIIDEINLAAQSVIEGLNGCLDYRRSLYLPEKGEIRMHPEAVIFATMNPKTERADGRKMLPKSFLSRFMCIKRDAMTEQDIQCILEQANTPVEENRAALVQQILSRIPQHRMNLRDCLRHMAIGSVHLVESLSIRSGANADTTASPAYSSPNLAQSQPPRTQYVATETELRVGRALLKGNLCRDREYVILHKGVTVLEICIWGLNKKWPVVLYGGVGQSRLVRFLAGVLGREWMSIACHRDMEPGDFLGQYVQGEMQTFHWEDAPFVHAVESGKIILLKNINLVRNDVVDRLNSLFEEGGTLEVHEKGGATPRTVVVHPETRFFLGTCEGGKDLSPALCNRAVQARLPCTLSAVDLAKIIEPVEQKEKGTPLSSEERVHQVSAGVIQAHAQARKVLGYNTFEDKTLATPYPDMHAFFREHQVKNYLVEKEIQVHLVDLMKNSLQKEVASVWFWGSKKEKELEQIVRREAETLVDKECLFFYQAAEVYEAARQIYKVCSVYEKEAEGAVNSASDANSNVSSNAAQMSNAICALERLKKSMEEGRSSLKTYFAGMDLPFMQRKDVSLRMAKIKLIESILDHRKERSSIKHLVLAKKAAEVLSSFPLEIERQISLAEKAPPAYKVLVELIDICLLYNIDPLIFPEIEEIERIARARIEHCIEITKKMYAQYKYGDGGIGKVAKKDRRKALQSTSVTEIRKRRKERNFTKFGGYLKKVIREVEEARHPETFAFSIVKRDMCKYADIWECFAYAVLKNAMERIAEKKQVVKVHPVGEALLTCFTGRTSATSALKSVVQYLFSAGKSFLSLTPLHRRVVDALWKAYTGEKVCARERSCTVLGVLLEYTLSGAYKEYLSDDAHVPYVLCKETEELICIENAFTENGVDLSVKSALEEPKIFASAELVSLIAAAEKEIRERSISVGKHTVHDWGEDDGAKTKLLERVTEILSTPASLPQQGIIKDLDSLNEECAHTGLVSVPLNKARFSVYSEFAAKKAYRMDRFSRIHSGWLLHIFNTVENNGSDGIIETFEEFLLQSTIGDMHARVNFVEQSIEEGAPYEIGNVCVYFRPYLEIADKKRAKIEDAVEKEIENVKIALAIRTKKEGMLLPIREASVLCKGEKIMETVEGLSIPILTIIKPYFFGSTNRCVCRSKDRCFLCLAQEVEEKKNALEKESMSVKMRHLSSLFEKLIFLFPRETTKNKVPAAADFYKKRFEGAKEEHIQLAKILHLGGSILRSEPHVRHQVASKIAETTTKAMNHALNTAHVREYPFILAALRVFYELMTYGFCGDEEDEAVEGEIEQLEDAGMRLGEGEKNISEKLKTEEEVGDSYKDEKEMYEEEMEEEDGVEMQNEGKVQETQGAEEPEEAEIDEGSVSESEEKYNQKERKDNLKKDNAEQEEAEAENEENEEAEAETESREASEDRNAGDDISNEYLNDKIEEDLSNEVDIQEMEMCSGNSSEYSRDALESMDEECMEEESLERLELASESSSEEISIEQYSSEEYQTNVYQYSFEELKMEPNTEQVFNETDGMASDDQVGNEDGAGAEREVAVGEGETINDQAEEEENFFEGPLRSSADKDTVRRAAFTRSTKEVDPVSYYKKIKHVTSSELTRQLSVVLEENEKAAYEGDYASGRRLNMKRIVSYVASDGQKNRIWMRKTKTQGRDYLIRIFVDNSGSIKNNGLVAPLVKSLSILCNSLDLLSIPYELNTFGTAVQMHGDMQKLVESLSFSVQETRISWIFEKKYSVGHNIIISDGLFYDSSHTPGRLSNTILLVLGDSKIKEMRSVKVVVGEVVIGRYLEVLGLPYCIVDNENLLEFVFTRELKNMLLLSKYT